MVSLWKCSAILFCICILSVIHVQEVFAEAPSTAGVAQSEVKFEKKKIQLGTKTLTVEVAETDAQHERGLMYRKNLGPDEGMLFIFKDEQRLYFWMKNTFIDLSIGYFDKDGTLIDIQEMKAVSSVMEENLPNYPSKKPALYGLEMNSHWFTKNKIKLGTKLKVLKDRQ